MLQFLTTPWFKYFVYPLFGAVLGVAIKYATRNDRYTTFKKDDLAVGLDLLKTAFLTLLVFSVDKSAELQKIGHLLTQAAQENYKHHTIATAQLVVNLQAMNQKLTDHVTDAWLMAIFLILAMWSLSTVVRKKGWANETELNTGVGIVVPLLIGVGSLILVMAKATAT
jgi:hypothetical protein